GATGAADKQGVTGEYAIAHEKAVGVVGMAGRVEHVERKAFYGELVALGKPHGDHVDLAALPHHGDAMGAIAQRAESGDVIGMQMGVDGLDQLEVELIDQLNVALDLPQHRVDDKRLATAPAGEEVGIGARAAVEELAKYHLRTLSASALPLKRALARARESSK